MGAMLSRDQGVANAGESWQGIRRILVVRLGALGDVVRTRFAFAGLRERFPEAELDWLVEDRCRAGLVGICGLDRVIEVPRSEWRAARPRRALAAARRLVRQLRERSYDLAVDFHSIAKSAIWPWLASVPRRVGYAAPLARESAQRLLTHCVSLGETHLSRFERNAALVHFLGGEVPTRAPPLRLEGSPPSGLPERFAVVHPGTSPGTEYKRWPVERFAAVARALREERNLLSVVTWGPVTGERERAEEVVRRSAGAALLAPETPDLGAVLAILARAQLFLGGDSGPMHLAALVGCPMVVVFGPTDPVENAPFPGVPSQVVRTDVGCNPCREGCPARSCLRAVEPAHVTAAALGLLERQPWAGAPPVG